MSGPSIEHGRPLIINGKPIIGGGGHDVCCCPSFTSERFFNNGCTPGGLFIKIGLDQTKCTAVDDLEQITMLKFTTCVWRCRNVPINSNPIVDCFDWYADIPESIIPGDAITIPGGADAKIDEYLKNKCPCGTDDNWTGPEPCNPWVFGIQNEQCRRSACNEFFSQGTLIDYVKEMLCYITMKIDTLCPPFFGDYCRDTTWTGFRRCAVRETVDCCRCSNITLDDKRTLPPPPCCNQCTDTNGPEISVRLIRRGGPSDAFPGCPPYIAGNCADPSDSVVYSLVVIACDGFPPCTEGVRGIEDIYIGEKDCIVVPEDPVCIAFCDPPSGPDPNPCFESFEDPKGNVEIIQDGNHFITGGCTLFGEGEILAPGCAFKSAVFTGCRTNCTAAPNAGGREFIIGAISKSGCETFMLMEVEPPC